MTLAERRRTETLYGLSPAGEPKRLEDDWPLKEPRSPDRFVFAENRLKALGFNYVAEGKTLSWIDAHADGVVYVDPRQSGRPGFEV
jgi:hypothetical protein